MFLWMKYHLRMPPSLHEALALKSESEDVSLNQFMITALARAVGLDEMRKSRPRIN
jgi:predicted HicB family RNase H-like nuclease